MKNLDFQIFLLATQPDAAALRLTRCLLLLSCMLTCLAGSAQALTLRAEHVASVRFEHKSTQLSASERQKLITAVEKVRNADWCPFQAAIVEGYQVPSESRDRSSAHALADDRATYVKNLLVRYGMPANQVISDLRPYSPSSADDGLNVPILFFGITPYLSCDVPRRTDGFRSTK